jgi:uncharacterized pyridoxamine 5'-phosphate oxidase family protein
MWEKKVFTKKLIVATSQYFTTDYTRRLYESLKQDNIDFTFLVAFDGSAEEKVYDISDIVDISLRFKSEIHSMPEIWNCLFNIAKSSDAEFVMFCDNDVEFKKGSLQKMLELTDRYDAISPVKIDNDTEKFKMYESNDDPVEVIGCNDSVWLLRLSKIFWNPENRKYGPFGFEDVPFMYNLWKNDVKFVVEPKAVVLHHCSQDTAHCFSSDDRKKYSDEWDAKRDYFLANNGADAKWFFNNIIMNQEAIKRFGFPVKIL